MTNVHLIIHNNVNNSNILILILRIRFRYIIPIYAYQPKESIPKLNVDGYVLNKFAGTLREIKNMSLA